MGFFGIPGSSFSALMTSPPPVCNSGTDIDSQSSSLHSLSAGHDPGLSLAHLLVSSIVLLSSPTERADVLQALKASRADAGRSARRRGLTAPLAGWAASHLTSPNAMNLFADLFCGA